MTGQLLGSVAGGLLLGLLLGHLLWSGSGACRGDAGAGARKAACPAQVAAPDMAVAVESAEAERVTEAEIARLQQQERQLLQLQQEHQLLLRAQEAQQEQWRAKRLATETVLHKHGQPGSAPTPKDVKLPLVLVKSVGGTGTTTLMEDLTAVLKGTGLRLNSDHDADRLKHSSVDGTIKHMCDDPDAQARGCPGLLK